MSLDPSRADRYIVDDDQLIITPAEELFNVKPVRWLVLAAGSCQSALTDSLMRPTPRGCGRQARPGSAEAVSVLVPDV